MLKLVEPTGGLDRLRRRGAGRAGGRAVARLPPPGAARVPEPVRCAQPALHHLSRRRRAADQRRHRQGRARRPRRLGLPPRPSARSRPLSRPLSAPAERRAAAARRAGARPGAGAALPGGRRAGLDARCQRARRHPGAAARGARRDGPDRRLHLPRPRAGALPLRAHPGDVSRPRRRGRRRPTRSCAGRAIPTPRRWSPPCRCPTPTSRAQPLPIKGNVPDAREPPSGCSFRDRCPHAMPRCAAETPPLRSIAGGHRVACHLELA